jgi:hypothetical protein
MKLPTLQSTTGLISWTFGLGLATYLFDRMIYEWFAYSKCILSMYGLGQPLPPDVYQQTLCIDGLKPRFLLLFGNEYLNLAFWIVVSCAILVVVKHFRRPRESDR